MEALRERLERRAVELWVQRNMPVIYLLEVEKQRTDRQHYLVSARMLAHVQTSILQPAVADWMAWLRKQLQAGVSDAVRARTAARATERIADWDKLEAHSLEFMRWPVLRALTYAAMVTTERGIRKQEDPMGEAAVDYTNEHTADLVTNVVRSTKDAIKLYIQQMVTYGLSARKVEMSLRPIVGLLPGHTAAVGNFLTRLLDAGVPFDGALKSATNYADKLHRYRTRMIARTESSFAQSEGILQGYEAMGVTHVRFIADPEACPICRGLHRTVFTIEEAHGLIPGRTHPQCECTWVAAPKPTTH